MVTPSDNNKGSEKLVLVVDDSPETLGMLNDALDEAGMTTLVALEGKQAITIAQKTQPDVILMDAIMPNMDGFETCRRIKQDPRLASIPVIFMTGLSDTDSIVKGLDAGGVDYLTKPINPTELIARMNVHLHNARTTLSAQQALDVAGQSIFAVDNQGQTRWSTPIVTQTIGEFSAQQQAKLSKSIASWLGHKPTSGNKLPLDSAVFGSIYLIYLEQTDDDEHLLRLVDSQELDEIAILRKEFPVTPRESEVFLWLARGKTNREIAQILDMSPRTVNKHLEQLFKKLDVDNRTSAAGLAIACLQQVKGY